jgi:peptidoglycan/LPS O-acetylase OafA/YrhL
MPNVGTGNNRAFGLSEHDRLKSGSRPHLTKATKRKFILRKNMPELDAVRGVAIGMVVLYHGFFWSSLGQNVRGVERLLILSTQPGWLGVDLFFVLSGFLISGLLIDAKGSSLKRFYVSFYARRSLRILPLYYLILITVGILLLAADEVSVGFISLSAIYLSNIAIWLGFKANYPLIVLWSLAIEEQFYLIWPTLIRILSLNQAFGMVLFLCVIEPIFRAVSFVNWGYVERGAAILTWYRLDSFAWGACLAFFLRSKLFTRTRFGLLTVLLMGSSLAMVVIGLPFGIATRSRLLGTALQFSAAAMFFAGCIGVVLLIGSSARATLVTPSWLRYLGRISYCLYLTHQICFWSYDNLLKKLALDQAFTRLDPLLRICIRAFLVIGGAIIISDLSRRYFEAYFLRLKSRFAFGNNNVAFESTLSPRLT